MTILLAGASAVGPIAQQSSRDYARLRAAVDADDFEKVVEVAEKIEAEGAGDASVAFELACAHAQLGSIEDAFGWLDRAVERGYEGLSRLDADTALDPLRGDPRFSKARRQVAARRRAGFARFRGMAARALPVALYRPKKDRQAAGLIIVALHGYGGSGAQTATLWRSVAEKNNALLLAPDALRPVERGFGWIFQDESEWWVLESLRRVQRVYGLEDVPVVLAGFSQGADVAMQVGLKHSDEFAGVIAISGYYEPSQMPISGQEPLPPFYLAVGKRDDPRDDTYRDAQRALKQVRATVKLRLFNGGHAYPRPVDKELARALKFVLKHQRK